MNLSFLAFEPPTDKTFSISAIKRSECKGSNYEEALQYSRHNGYEYTWKGVLDGGKARVGGEQGRGGGHRLGS